jgi:diguanylate cyclase (GGDEF)-like protein
MMSVLDDSTGDIWIAVEGRGLMHLKGRSWRLFDHRDGLPDDWVAQVTDDADGNLWLGTHSGIVSIPKAAFLAAAPALARLPVRLYTTRDGLATNYCDSIAAPDVARAPDGRLWFPTTWGIAVVDPRRIRTNPLSPTVVVEEVRVGGRSVPLAPSLRLGAGVDRLEIEYTATSFVAPERVRFRYRLEGADPGWVEAGSDRVARYGHLGPGQYRFTVIAANSDGVWSRAGAPIELAVAPRWHETWSFYSAAVLLPTLLGAAMNRLRGARKGRELGRRQAQLERAVEERTSELTSARGEVEAQKQELEKANQRLEQLTLTDSLTEIVNRRGFEARLELEHRRASRGGAPLALLLFDVDWFKQYNDAHGHARGDYCLREIARVATETFPRDGDQVARFGGDEFAVLLPDCDTRGGRLAAERLRVSLAAAALPHPDSAAGRVTLSMGLAVFQPKEAKRDSPRPPEQVREAIERLFAAADAALYQAKRSGRDQIVAAENPVG